MRMQLFYINIPNHIISYIVVRYLKRLIVIVLLLLFCYVSMPHIIINKWDPLADPGGGRTRRAPPLTAADLWFF